MNTLLWYLRQGIQPLGRTGLAGVALGVLALLLSLAGTRPLLADNTATRQRLDVLRQAAAAAPQTAREPAADADADPLASLPPTGEAAEHIGELERLARSHGIALPRGQYSASAQPGTRLVRWQVTLPVEAEYPALVAWLAAALERLPSLTLDDMKLKREQIESRTLQAQLRLSLYVEATP